MEHVELLETSLYYKRNEARYVMFSSPPPNPNHNPNDGNGVPSSKCGLFDRRRMSRTHLKPKHRLYETALLEGGIFVFDATLMKVRHTHTHARAQTHLIISVFPFLSSLSFFSLFLFCFLLLLHPYSLVIRFCHVSWWRKWG